MPIDFADWNSGKKVYTLKEKISSFLSKNPEKAFDIKEIIEGTGYSIQILCKIMVPPQNRDFAVL